MEIEQTYLIYLLLNVLPLLLGVILDLALGDPLWLPHPVVGFGKLISFGEKRLNQGGHRMAKGAFWALFCILFVFATTFLLVAYLPPLLEALFVRLLGDGAFSQGLVWQVAFVVLSSVLVFFCLAGRTLCKEVRDVFLAVDESLEKGRRQVARIVGRDTSELSAQEVRTAALETLAENLSDGVVAPLFWFLLLGVPGMMAYKMVNTLDSMIGYRTERYREFGCWAARIDDVFNYVPARLTAVLLVFSYTCFYSNRGEKGSLRKLLNLVAYYSRCHASPNSGWPESALAGILDCRFGGPHYYFGEYFYKPFIGDNPRELTTADMRLSIQLSLIAGLMMVVLVAAVLALLG